MEAHGMYVEHRSHIERIDEWQKWVGEIPYINFPKDWSVKIIPPFGGAIVRFRVIKRGDNPDNWVSIYLDCYDSLGIFGSPYWEIYPFKDDICRIPMNDVDDLVAKIQESLDDFTGNF